MKQFYDVLENSCLFSNISSEEMEQMMDCLKASRRSYRKGEYIYHSGDNTKNIAIVLSGSVLIQNEDYWGNQSILTKVTEGELFGEAYACGNSCEIQVNALAQTDTTILLIDVNHMITTCSSSCQFHLQLIHNLLQILSSKNLMLTNKIQSMSQRSLRDKILSYLSQQSLQQNSKEFDIPFNRQQMADYLSVDRSALSNELSKLQREHIIYYKKSHFELL